MTNPSPLPNKRSLTTPHDYIEDWEDKVAQLSDPNTRVCQNCVVDSHLSDPVADNADEAGCDFCGTTTQVVRFEDLAVVVENFLGDLYRLGAKFDAPLRKARDG